MNTRDALEDRLERRLLQHLLAVERRHRHRAGHGVDPPGRHRAVGVGVERLLPRQRTDDARARLAGEAAGRRLDQAGLFAGSAAAVNAPFGDRAFQTRRATTWPPSPRAESVPCRRTAARAASRSVRARAPARWATPAGAPARPSPAWRRFVDGEPGRPPWPAASRSRRPRRSTRRRCGRARRPRRRESAPACLPSRSSC